MRNYLDLVRDVYETGSLVPTRSQPTVEKFGAMLKFENVGEQFPLVTAKYVPLKVVLAELCSFLRGYRTVDEFNHMGCKIWDANGNADYWRASPNFTDGYLGRIYGVQWREFIGINGEGNVCVVDQMKNLVQGLRDDPHGRRHVVTAWNPAELDQMCLPPCHILFQCNVTENGVLNLCFYQRSCDLFLGVPFDIASYAALMLVLCNETGYTPGDLTYFMGSVHIYQSHFSAVEEMLSNEPWALPKVTLCSSVARPIDSATFLHGYVPDDFILDGYDHCGKIFAPMVV